MIKKKKREKLCANAESFSHVTPIGAGKVVVSDSFEFESVPLTAIAMKVRRNPLPRRLIDAACYLVIGIFLPIVFIFEIIVVLPAIHEPGGFLHTFTFLMAMFLLFNIKGNMLACMLIDTSVDREYKLKIFLVVVDRL